MRRRNVITLLLILGILIAGVVVTEMKNGFDISKVEAWPSGRNSMLDCYVTIS